MTARSPGIVLVHGYTGSHRDFDFLLSMLVEIYGTDSTAMVSLPGHDITNLPAFDAEACMKAIACQVDRFALQGRPVVLVGHSTGGSLVLDYLDKSGFVPRLLILAGAPKRLDTTWLERWENHRDGREAVPLNSIAKIISLVNKAGNRRYHAPFPVHIIQGESDSLVPAAEARLWDNGTFAGSVSTTMIPQGAHDIFQGLGKKEAAQSALSAIENTCPHKRADDKSFRDALISAEPESKLFFDYSLPSLPFVAASPSGQTFMGVKAVLSSVPVSPPVIANIEITTRCMLRCPHCARSFLERKEEDMTEETFDAVLNKLPHAYRITFVGLGEPLMHPGTVDFVAKASSQGKRVGLVTNAMRLDSHMSQGLIDAGLASIAFSLDAVEPSVAAEVRKGSNLPLILENIGSFIKKAQKKGAISTALFTAVSTKTAPHLKGLFDCAKELGIHVAMLTDLNFKENLDNTVRQNRNDDLEKTIHDAIAYAFSQGLPVLSVHGLEEFGLRQRYKEFLLVPPGALYERSSSRKWCSSPWQTIPVDVTGTATICDCRPDIPVGSLLEHSLDDVWNGRPMRNHREKMLGNSPPDQCRICPRF